jgi:hypothetical protein
MTGFSGWFAFYSDLIEVCGQGTKKWKRKNFSKKISLGYQGDFVMEFLWGTKVILILDFLGARVILILAFFERAGPFCNEISLV